ncbi:MAG: PAS domain-containing sensor histidine kinase [Microscillaceae bacterium]|jgi:PAS domain S-box-containing protein|nr:PAS domain-containing sensor histidine kinase [Microscillaceae bacterium]
MNTTRRFRIYYYSAIVLLVLLTGTATYWVVQAIEQSQKHTHLIYLLSRQRTRTQRVVKNTLLLDKSFTNLDTKIQAQVKAEFQTAYQQLQNAEIELLEYDSFLQSLKQYASTQKLLLAFLAEIQIIDTQLKIKGQVLDYQVDIAKLYDLGNQYIDLLIGVIDQISHQNEGNQQFTARLVMVIGAVFLGCFVFITFGIFNPTIHKLDRAFGSLETKNEDLSASQAKLQSNLDALYHSQTKLQAAFAEIQDLYDNVPVGYHSLNGEGLIIKMNRTELSWLGYTAEEVIGKKYFWELTPDGNKDLFVQRFAKLKAEGSVKNQSFRLMRKDGSPLEVLLNATAIFDEAGSFLHSRSSMIDRTEIAQAEAQAQKFQTMLYETEKLAQIGSWEFDADSLQPTWTSGIYEVYQLPIDQTPKLQLINRLYSIDNQKNLQDLVQRCLREGKGYDFELPFTTLNNEIKWARAIGKPLFENNRVSKVYGFLQDITERKLAEMAIQEKNEELEALTEEIQQNMKQLDELNHTLEAQNSELKATDQLKNKLFAIIAHDLRSPFATLKGLVELLQIDALSENEKTMILAELKKKNDNVSSTLDNLLLWANSLLGGEVMNLTTIHLWQIAQDTIDFLQILAQPKQIEIINQIDTNELVLADKNMLTVILRNLAANSIKFTPSGGKITLHAYPKNEKVEIWVSDTGVGMEVAKLDILFKNQTTSEGTNQEKGTGLGLLICQEFVEKMGGRIWAESEVGRGSTFKFRLSRVET